ncbi:MAG: T9SS type A sorting domain-containing protein [Crocinitomicaceae bacterium]
MKQYVVFIMLFCCSLSTTAQVTTEQLFKQLTAAGLSKVFDHVEVDDGIILSCMLESGLLAQPVILKVDFSGDVIWTTRNGFTNKYTSIWEFNLKLFEDGYLYGHLLYNETINTNNKRLSGFWKLNATTGTISWAKGFITEGSNAAYYEYSDLDIYDYDSSNFYITYGKKIGPSTSFPSIAKMSKATGDTLQTRHFSGSIGGQGIAVDKQMNIYYSNKANVLKFNRDDLSTILWEKSFQDLDYDTEGTHEIYFDNEDELYLFGFENFGISDGGTQFCIKINKSNGKKIWLSDVYYNDVKLQDMIETNSKLYFLYRHIYVGASICHFSTAKLNKDDGVVDWNSFEHHTPFPSFQGSPVSWASEAALSMDMDCNEDLYLTGYYWDGNYGPGSWGTMKVDGNTGNKVFDFTITIDSVNNNEKSSGIASCIYGDSAIVIGNLENLNGAIEPTFVKYKQADGAVLLQKPFDDRYKYLSRTIDIKKIENDIYIFKQIGKDLKLEKYVGNLSNLQWQKGISETHVLLGKQMEIVGENIFISVQKQALNLYSKPFYSDTIEEIKIYQLLNQTGVIQAQDSIPIYTIESKSLEIEADSSQMYIFFDKNDSVFYSKWNTVAVSPPLFIEPSVNRTPLYNDYDLAHNISNSIVYTGATELKFISKISNTLTNTFPYGATNTFYSTYGNSDTLFACGQDAQNSPVIKAFNLGNSTLMWEKSFSTTGSFINIEKSNSGELYTTGISENKLIVNSLNSLNGDSLWAFEEDTLLYNGVIPNDISINKASNYLTIVGTIPNAQNTDIFIKIMSLQGDTSVTIVENDDVEEVSYASTSTMINDNNSLVGGTINQNGYSKEGFVFKTNYFFVDSNLVDTTILQSINICQGDSISIFQNYHDTTGTFYQVLTNYLGLDSVIIQDLIVNQTYDSSLVPVSICPTDSILIFGTYRSATGIYFDSLQTVFGCDSVFSQELNHFTNFYGSLPQEFICLGDSTLIFGNYQSLSGSYFDSLLTVNGCDSVIQVDLAYYSDYNIQLPQVFICNNDSVQIHGNYQQLPGFYTDSLQTASGCDSILNQELSYYPDYFTQLPNEIICEGDSISLFGTYQNQPGVYFDTLNTVNGCDSVFAVSISEITIDTSLSTQPLVLTSNHISGSYQWIDCLNNSLLVGETNQSFAPIANGIYAVVITDNGCSDTSTCYVISSISIIFPTAIVSYPNPTTGTFTIDLGEMFTNVQFTVVDVLGRTILTENYDFVQIIEGNLDESNGTYFAEVRNVDNLIRLIIVKN